MGEIADMMIDGLLCSCCGSHLDDFTAPGYERICEDCENETKK